MTFAPRSTPTTWTASALPIFATSGATSAIEQDPLLILPQIGKTLEIDDEGQLLLEGRHFGNRLGQEVVVL
jgi:hypothetical protein